MKKRGRVLVIGLGQFGSSVAMSLGEHGVDVIALDSDEARVAAVADRVAQARVASGSDLNVLSELRVDATSAVLNAIGDEFLLDSILCTAHLRQLGAPRLIARATNDVHARVLRAIGADEIIQPEREIGQVLARRIARVGVTNQFDLGDTTTVVELTIPEIWIDRTLAQLNLRKRHGLQVAAVQKAGSGDWQPAEPDAEFRRGDHVLVFGPKTTIESLVGGSLR